MKLNENFITQSIGSNQIMVAGGDAAFSGFVRSNETAAFIVEKLKTETTKDEIIDAMLDRYDASREKISGDVEKILSVLRSIGALDE